MNEIDNLKNEIVSSLTKSDNAAQVVEELLKINEEYSYRGAYNKLQRLGLFRDDGLEKTVVKAGFLLIGVHEVLKSHISESLEKDSNFDVIDFKYRVREKFKEQLKTVLQDKQQKKLDSSLHKQEAELHDYSHKRKSDVITSSQDMSHVDRLKQQETIELAIKFILGNDSHAKEFEALNGEKALDNLKALTNVKAK